MRDESRRPARAPAASPSCVPRSARPATSELRLAAADEEGADEAAECGATSDDDRPGGGLRAGVCGVYGVCGMCGVRGGSVGAAGGKGGAATAMGR